MKRIAVMLIIFALAGTLGYAKGKKTEGGEKPQEGAFAQEDQTRKSGAEAQAPEAAVPAQRKGPRIEKVDDATLRFLDEQGRVRKEMKLRKNTHFGKVPPKYDLYKRNPEADVKINDEERAFPSPTGEHVAIVHEESIEGDEFQEDYGRTIKVLDAKTGTVVMERGDITSIWASYSENGRRIQFGIKNTQNPENDCLFVYDLPTKKAAIVLNDFKHIGYSKLSPNGRYLTVTVENPDDAALLYDLDTGEKVQKEGRFVSPRVFDDGTAELYIRQNRQDVLAERLAIK